jgi:hypothetical protein
MLVSFAGAPADLPELPSCPRHLRFHAAVQSAPADGYPAMGTPVTADGGPATHGPTLEFGLGHLRRQLGLPDAATALLSETLRRTADRPAELLHALRYERALAYEAAGQTKRARADLERLYAEASDYEDVARRLRMAT